MAVPNIPCTPPELFTAGDTLLLNQNYPNYLPSDGWAIHLTVSNPLPNAAQLAVTVISVPDATNVKHTFNVPGFCAALPEGIYILSEEMVNAGTGEKHQIYFNDEFAITPDLGDGLATGPDQTEAQQMLTIISATLKQLYAQKFTETDVQRNRFILQKTQDALMDYKFWTAKRQQEIQIENVRNGRPSGAVVQPYFLIG